MITSKTSALLAGALFCTVAIAQADTVVTFSVNMSNQIAGATFTPGVDTVSARGTFNGYGTFPLSPSVSDTNIYEGTITNNTDPNGGKMEYKFHNSNGDVWETTATGQNRAVLLPEASGASLVLPTPYFSDSGPTETNLITFQVDVSQQINLGVFSNLTSTVDVRGNFNGWAYTTNVLTHDPAILRTNTFGQVSSNVYVGTFEIAGSPASAMAFKYVIDPGGVWDSPSAVNQDGGGNRYFANVAQTLPIVDFSDQPYALLDAVTFRVDMSVQVLSGAFSNQLMYLAGSFNGWSTSGTPLTNDPGAVNTNIYSAVVTLGQQSSVTYKFTYQGDVGTVWESPASTGGGDRPLTVPATNETVLPAVFWNDLELNDVLTQPTPVFFSVDMNGAVGSTTNAHVFNPSIDRVFINGQFANWYPWYGGITPAPAPAGYELFDDGSLIYTNTIMVPAGVPVDFQYKYGMGLNGDPGPTDNEAAFGSNHFRVVRSTALNPYPMPQDTFGNMYGEPFFSLSDTSGGQLQVGAPSGGMVPVTWLGRPGARLQVTTDVAGGSWTTLTETDGTNWTDGASSMNGLVSTTNWPATDKAMFRLVKPTQ